MSEVIVVDGLVKSFDAVQALDRLSFSVAAGEVLGLLGPNGAGKTTAVRILATLLGADDGYASVCGLDVARHPQQVRRRIGLTGQFAALDENLTGRENLLLFGRLFHLGKREASARAEQLLERFDLVDVGARLVKTYSGGMRRRLDIAASLISRPQVLFLDEPTTGLDPRSRLRMWSVIGELVADGTTLLLTTQYLDEADALASRIAVIDHGRVIATGTAPQLKAQVGGARLELLVGAVGQLDGACAALVRLAVAPIEVDAAARLLAVPVEPAPGLLTEAVRRLDAEGVEIVDLALRRPTLDDVFLALTGHPAQPGTDATGEPSGSAAEPSGSAAEPSGSATEPSGSATEPAVADSAEDAEHVPAPAPATPGARR